MKKTALDFLIVVATLVEIAGYEIVPSGLWFLPNRVVFLPALTTKMNGVQAASAVTGYVLPAL